ncbi:ABC transporter permease [Leptospira langatensis]|uniref:ABC transporter permease n=1 Tax=Leptospira langatensis TaxID=2484983 RepID=A0A5F1ZV74_9LEPT|nr:ABC transporter permease [Leptospira langatensis]TGK00216.1 ABC transporter permease [Leptospira langatensis]TGL41152.1 ABC transporter permease [Leptospira langatensis]
MFQSDFLRKFRILLVLVRRDYALQYAGSALGLTWMFLQNLSLILIYTVVFYFLGIRSQGEDPLGYFAYVLSGLLFWIPLQEYLIRGTGILTDNRQLIKRSPLGPEIFLWIPFIQFLLHWAITAVPIFLFLAWAGKLGAGLPLAFLCVFCTGLFIACLQSYLARINIILRDISPLVRLMTQFLFWGLPILYESKGILGKLNLFNPLFFPLETFRSFLLSGYESKATFADFFPFLILFLAIFFLSRAKLNQIVLDHL